MNRYSVLLVLLTTIRNPLKFNVSSRSAVISDIETYSEIFTEVLGFIAVIAVATGLHAANIRSALSSPADQSGFLT